MTKPGLRLIPIDADLETILDGDEAAFADRYRARLDDCAGVVREITGQMMALVRSRPRAEPWGGYLVIDDEEDRVIGTCAFKDGPSAEATVEIAYFTFPAFEGRGYGSAMASALVRLAEGAGEVRQLLAHTLPAPNASGRILEKNGFRRVGEVVDPEDGPVWRWERDL